MYSSLVSVIIPAYNAENHIIECINSVLNQTHRHLEIIIVNDGSTDKTIEVLKFIQDDRIILINQDNQGCSSAKNSGLRIAKGDFIQYLDADDILSPDKIQNQLFRLESEQNKIAVCKTAIFEEHIEKLFGEIDTELIQKEGSGLCFLLRLLGSEGSQGMVQPNAYLLPKRIVDDIGDWNIEISPSPDEDGEYFARALLAAEEVIFTGGINYYRKVLNKKSLSQIHNLQRAINLLNTVELKFQHIFEIERTPLTENLFQLNISKVAYQYGVKYPEIISNAQEILESYSIGSLKVDKPVVFRFFSTIIGFRNTILLKRLLKWQHSYFNTLLS